MRQRRRVSAGGAVLARALSPYQLAELTWRDDLEGATREGMKEPRGALGEVLALAAERDTDIR